VAEADSTLASAIIDPSESCEEAKCGARTGVSVRPKPALPTLQDDGAGRAEQHEYAEDRNYTGRDGANRQQVSRLLTCVLEEVDGHKLEYGTDDEGIGFDETLIEAAELGQLQEKRAWQNDPEHERQERQREAGGEALPTLCGLLHQETL